MSVSGNPERTPIDDDKPIWGAMNIARACGQDRERAAFYLCERLLEEGVITRVGRRLVGLPSKLRARFTGRQSSAA